MSKKGHSGPGLFGGINHYDENGKKIGHSEPGLFGGYTHYDKHGNKTGHSDPGLFGGYNHYDKNGNKAGYSNHGLFGGMNHYDKNGKPTGHSTPGLFGGMNHRSSTDGCYIATAVYGSYDCPEVWTLRRFRDYRLKNNLFGKVFIKVYYATSPTMVRLFGKTKTFNRFWRKVLDRKVQKLKKQGYESTPYTDRG